MKGNGRLPANRRAGGFSAIRLVATMLAVLVIVSGCASAQESVQGLKDRIANIDVDSALDGLRDCDKLSETFVGLVQTAADTVDGLAERTDGRVPVTDIREAVDNIAVSRYFDFAEAIGCAQLQQRLNTVDQLRDLSPDTPAGEDFLEQILRQVEAGV